MEYKPLVSVCLPVRNGEKTLRRAIDSVLEQTYQKFEIVISDNASTDSTEQIISSYMDERIHCFKNSVDVDCYPNHNYCISHSQGEYITFIHSDDEYSRDRLELLVGALQDHPEAGFAYNAVQIQDSEGKFSRVLHGHDRSGVFDGIDELAFVLGDHDAAFGHINPPLVRRKILERAGGYDSRFPFNADAYLHWELSLLADAYYLDEPLYNYTAHKYSVDDDPFLITFSNYFALRSFLQEHGGDHALVPALIRKAMKREMHNASRTWVARAVIKSKQDPLRLISSVKLLTLAFVLSPLSVVGLPFSRKNWQRLKGLTKPWTAI